MSGETQPKKRKDKKRKKDEGGGMDYLAPPPPFIPMMKTDDDTNIHVHKEGGTGGGICAKVIFFFLFSALIVLVGLIITEHRGLTDLEKAETQSRFSQLFEGWVDDSPTHEEDDHQTSHAVSEEHDDNEALDEDNEDEDQLSEEVNGTEEEEPAASEEDEDNLEDVEEDEASQADEDNDDEEEQQEDEDQLEDEEEEDQAESEEQDNQEDEEEEEEEERFDEIEESTEDNLGDQDEDEDQGVDASEEHNEEEENEQDEDDQTENEDGQSEEIVLNEPDEDDNEIDVKISRSSEKKESKYDKDDGYESSEKTENSVKEKKTERRTKPKASAERQEEIVPEYSGPNIEPDASKVEEASIDNKMYINANITNKEDWIIRDEIDEVDKFVENNPAYAIKLFDALLVNHPTSPRILYGKARAFDNLADLKRSNPLLQKAIFIYMQLLSLKDVPDILYIKVAERCIDRMRFLGKFKDAISLHNMLIDRFSYVPNYRNNLAVTYLTIGRINEARNVLKEVLNKWPNDGFALVHYGFILKTSDNKLEESVKYMKKGIETKEAGVVDGRFYFHLGDALSRLGRYDEAMKVYEEGVQLGLFLSKYQRSLYNVNNLTGKPWWNKSEIPYQALFNALEKNYKKIYQEGLSVMNERGYFQDESENLKDKGDWKQFELFARGQKNVENCRKCPFTCQLIDSFPDAKSCKRGQTKFSVMHPGTHVWAHCGPTNCRLRVHLGLKVPANTFIRVAEETKSWKEGEVIIFDDSFEHEVWHNGTEFRLVLIVDVWHPELTSVEKRNLSPI